MAGMSAAARDGASAATLRAFAEAIGRAFCREAGCAQIAAPVEPFLIGNMINENLTCIICRLKIATFQQSNLGIKTPMTNCTKVVLWNLLPPWSPHAPGPVSA